jgi:hypothetical protein
MKVTKDIHIHCTEGDLELRIGKTLTTFAYKGQDKFVFRTAELESLVAMLQQGKKELDDFYIELKNETPNTNTAITSSKQ